MPKEKNQMSTLSKKSTVIVDLYNSPKWKPKIMKIFEILQYVKIQESDIIEIIEKYKKDKSNTDSKIMNSLLKLNFIPENLYNENVDISRGFGKWKRIKTHLTKPIGSILDMGGNIGTTAMVIGRKILKLTKEKTFVVDIDEWAGEKWTPRNDITFVHYDFMEKIPDKSIDLITIFHTLHHISTKEYPNILRQVHRILSHDGCIVLYEHNCACKDWAGLIDIEHALYDVIVSKKILYNKFAQTNHYAKYYSINKWKLLFENAGFKEYFTEELNNKDNSFYIYFRKC